MPNNLVFNNAASQLQVQLYGMNNGSSVSVKTDANGNLITISPPLFTESNTTIAAIAATTVTAMTQDTSLTKALSFYVFNLTANTCTAWLQVSPTVTESYYMNDPTSFTTIAPNARVFITPYIFLHYTRLLMVGSEAATTSAEIYYNAQS